MNTARPLRIPYLYSLEHYHPSYMKLLIHDQPCQVGDNSFIFDKVIEPNIQLKDANTMIREEVIARTGVYAVPILMNQL